MHNITCNIIDHGPATTRHPPGMQREAGRGRFLDITLTVYHVYKIDKSGTSSELSPRKVAPTQKTTPEWPSLLCRNHS